MKLTALDKLFSDYIRLKAIKTTGGCERCLTPKFDIVKENGDTFPAYKQLQCSHFNGRGSKSVRYDEDNACGLCGVCHMYLEHHSLEHTEFFKKRLGDGYDLLFSRARVPARYLDIKALTIYYKEKIKQLEVE